MDIRKLTEGFKEYTFAMKEYPFYYDGMPLEEWREEYIYFAEHLSEVHKGKYVPLWKQRMS